VSSNGPPSLQEQLSRLFGSYRAEWLREQTFELFSEPSYFPDLTTNKSCVLIGGRGTGKTTVLKGLSYQGQFALKGRNKEAIATSTYFGLYYRVNTNHVTAFKGPELPAENWKELFAHYINILLCDLMLEFVEWYEVHTGSDIEIGASTARRFAASMHLAQVATHREIREALLESRIAFEAYINNVVDAPQVLLSLQGAPVDLLSKALLQLPFMLGKQFFFLIDEYENLLDDQQEVVNTLIKHAGESYCFKIGVRELGWRCRHTLNENEQLIHPADYDLVNIAEKLQGDVFQQFAYNVCCERLRRLEVGATETVLRDVRDALPGISEDEEAERLGIADQIKGVSESLTAACDATYHPAISALSPLELYFIRFWAENEQTELVDVFLDSQGHPKQWKDRFGNYKHALLFTIRRKKRGIRKFYAGWSVFTLLAAGNIRYVLELVDESLLAHFEKTKSLAEPVTIETQTQVAQRVGQMNLSELEGLSVDGAQLTKLLLSLGRVFQVMASKPLKHAPEVNQFEISSINDEQEQSLIPEVDRLLTSAVMHLALLRSPGNKLGEAGATKEYDYMVHPLFAPLFEFSYRRKRKMVLRPSTLIGLVTTPKQTIREVLKEQNRAEDADLPEQLMLFERFYNADSE
jgi:hypothetical protein